MLEFKRFALMKFYFLFWTIIQDNILVGDNGVSLKEKVDISIVNPAGIGDKKLGWCGAMLDQRRQSSFFFEIT